jgi:hypothetical protein
MGTLKTEAEMLDELNEAYGEIRANQLVIQTFGTIKETYAYAVSQGVI